jgi:predicted DNA-binding transcriptional regulator AlpA
VTHSGDDTLINIAEIRKVFRLQRTAAYELTRRPGFPDPVLLSPRCYRWWASEVTAFARSLQRKPARRARVTAPRRRGQPDPAVPPRISGTVRAAQGRKAAS